MNVLLTIADEIAIVIQSMVMKACRMLEGQAPFRALNMGNSPIHVMSPMSNRSESSTLVQTAPVVSSMLPLAQCEVRQEAPMDVLGAWRSRKVSQARSVAQANGEIIVQEVNLLKAKLKAAEPREAQHRAEVKTLASQLK